MQMRVLKSWTIALMTVVFAMPAITPLHAAPQVDARLVKEIRHELATLPYYGVFD
jgi:hypothetical protein